MILGTSPYGGSGSRGLGFGVLGLGFGVLGESLELRQ